MKAASKLKIGIHHKVARDNYRKKYLIISELCLLSDSYPKNSSDKEFLQLKIFKRRNHHKKLYGYKKNEFECYEFSYPETHKINYNEKFMLEKMNKANA